MMNVQKESRNSNLNLDECPVCLESHPLNQMTKTKCDHHLCKPCAVQLLKRTVRCPVCRQRITMFDTVLVETGEALVKPFDSIYGSIYVQGNTEGLASYHFSEEESYISYSAAPPIWKLDDGTSPPEKKPFEDPSYNSDTRTFRGTITWPVSFGGDSKWMYRIVFSDDYLEIESGEVTAFDEEGNRLDRHMYGHHLFYTRIIDIEKLL